VPALGFCVTVVVAVSIHPDGLVHIQLYTPGAVKFEIVVVGLVGVAMVAVPGFPAIAAHDAPAIVVAPIAAAPPGKFRIHPTTLSPPAFGFTVTVT